MDIQRPLEGRRSDVHRVNSHGVKLHRFTVQTSTRGVGEAEIEIPFPVWFTDMPGFSFGSSLDGTSPEGGNFPTVSAVVTRWYTESKRGDGTGLFYVGANVAVVLSGHDEQRAILHTHFEGKALRNVKTNTDNLDGELA